jgi:hypothetical protein
MTGANEPKKETTRIDVQTVKPVRSPESNANRGDTLRLPANIHPPPGPPPEEMVAPNSLASADEPVVSPMLSVDPAPDLPSAGPRKETVRIPPAPGPLLPEISAAQMKKTQPLLAAPAPGLERAAIAVAPVVGKDMPLLWVVLGGAALILIIQIWIYFS